MLRNLFTTTASRLIIAVINLGIVWVSARFLGAEILGTISLIILGISIIQMVTSVMAGSSLVYQASRHSVAALMVMAWIWILVSGFFVWIVLDFLSLIPNGYSLDVLWLSVAGSVITVNQNLFLGKERVNLFNGMAILQTLLVLASLVYFVVLAGWTSTGAYVAAQYISMITCAVVGIYTNLPPLKEFRLPERVVVSQALKFGGYLQAASFMQLFNYRLSYYLIEKFFDRATLGVFSLGVQIAESVWILSKSMAVLLYSRLSNNRDSDYATGLTLNFIKLTVILSLILVIVIVMLPPEFFVWVFHDDFNRLNTVIFSLAPGILAIAVSLMYSHYFSGTGKPVYNTFSSGIGLVLTIVLGLTLIPAYGLTGAGLTASFSYLGSMLYQSFVFKRTTGTLLKDYIPAKSDFNRVKQELNSLFSAT